MDKKPKKFPPQHQRKQPGIESKMDPLPDSAPKPEGPKGKLHGKVALITGGDSGIGRAVALLFAKEGANIVISYLNEHADAEKTRDEVLKYNVKAHLVPGDISEEKFCKKLVNETVKKFGTIDILINNAVVQLPQDRIEDISSEQLIKTFSVNVFAAFYITIAALPHMKAGASIINSTSVTAYRGSHHLIDYSSTKGALVSFTRSLSASLVEKGIRVNAVAPGPIWTPLIPSTFDADHVKTFGQDTPMKRAGQPDEVAGCYLFLASEDSSYMTGQVLHPNGGEIVNG